MPREKLTAGRVRDFTTDKGQAFLWDTEVPGLAVRATPSGHKAYIFQGKLAGKDVRITIGDVRAWLLDNTDPGQIGARQEARRMQTLLDQGIDPRLQKKERLAATLAKRERDVRHSAPAIEAWRSYVDSRKGKWSASHLRDHDVMVQEGGKKRSKGRRKGEPETTQPGMLLALLANSLQSIDANALQQFLDAETAKRPTRARKAFTLLRAFFNWCHDHPDYRDQVNTEIFHVRAVRDSVPRPRAKDDCLQREQLKLWFDSIREIDNPIIAAYLQCTILTGPRREELATLRWVDIDFQWKKITMKDKVEGQRVIPLTPYVESLLRHLKALNETPPHDNKKVRPIGKAAKAASESKWKPSPWVFSSKTSETGYITDPGSPHATALENAGLPHVTIHGLRRSFSTLSEWVEVPTGIVAQIMGHKPSALAEKHYRKRPIDLLRMWHTKIETWILEQAEIEPLAEVKATPRLAKA